MTYLQRDLSFMGYDIRIPVMKLMRFWQMLAHSQSQLANLSRLAMNMELSRQSVHKYLDILHEAQIVIPVIVAPNENLDGQRAIGNVPRQRVHGDPKRPVARPFYPGTVDRHRHAGAYTLQIDPRRCPGRTTPTGKADQQRPDPHRHPAASGDFTPRG